MKFADYSPPATPSVDQQRDALKKGLGRAMQWAISGRLDEATLLDAIKVLKTHTRADVSQLGVVAYTLTPCGTCRFDALRLLRARNACPDWAWEESRFDANRENREFFESGGQIEDDHDTTV